MATVKCAFCLKEYHDRPGKKPAVRRLERHLRNEHHQELVSAGIAGRNPTRTELEDFLIPGQLRFDFHGLLD